MSKVQAGQEPTARDQDEALVRACQGGDDDAFGVLVERHQKKMLNVAYRMTGDYDEACDIVQDAFLSAYRAIGKFRGDARFSTWLCGIVINAGRTRLKRTKDYQRKTVSLEGPGGEFEPLVTRIASAEASALKTLQTKEIQAKVQHCIGTLGEEHREAIVLRDILGLAYDEIAAILRVPEGTVKSRLFRAREGVKNCLKTVLGNL